MGMTIVAKKKPGPKPSEGVGRTVVTNIRSTPAWREWLVELSGFRRLTVADVIDQALVAYARDNKFPRQAPPR
jgi:hypothetical protein